MGLGIMAVSSLRHHNERERRATVEKDVISTKREGNERAYFDHGE